MSTYIHSLLVAVCVVIPAPVSNTQFFGSDGNKRRIGQLFGRRKLSEEHTYTDEELWLTPLVHQTVQRLKSDLPDTLPAFSLSRPCPHIQARGSVFPLKRMRKQRTRFTLRYR